MRGRFRILIASTGLLLLAAPSARAQMTARETGSLTVGGYLLWVRGTNANVVELFVGRGFRDAFARSHDMDAARVQQWIDSVRAASPVPAEDSSAGDSGLGGSALGADVTMMRRIGGTFSGLRVLVSGEDPIRMAESTARDFIAMLDSAARVTRELSAPRTPVVASAPAQSAAPPTTAMPAAPPTPAPAPEVAIRAPSQKVAMLGASSVAMPAPAPVVVPTPARTVAAPTATSITASVAVTPVAPAPVATTPSALPAPRETIAAPPAAEPSDKLIRTPLGPFIVPAALLSDRDKQAQYCYKQLGLKYNPDLKGEITVKLSLGTDGAVQDAVVTKRSWQGISAGEVESCVRALAHDWTFASTDPAVTSGAKIVTFSFAP